MRRTDLALEFVDVHKRYRNGTLALDGVTWSIATGARACLLGPNGAGKSTAIRLLQGAIEPTRGTVRLLGAMVNGPDYLKARQRTGIVPQGPGMYQDVTVGEYLDLARRLYGRSVQDMNRVIEAFGLGEYRSRMLNQLSGGYQRRLSLAAALLPEPDLLLLDEPTVGLDPVATHEVHNYLRELMPGRTTLLCTHNLAEAEALCDEVVILRAGKVLVHEPLTALRGRESPRLYLAARQGGAALGAVLTRRGLQFEPSDEGVLLSVSDPQQDAPALLRALLDEGIDVYECRPVRPTLQSVFLDVVQRELDSDPSDAEG